MSGPPPPPPHGGVPKGSGLPPGKYDIFVIPEHSSGGGFLYLPSMQPNVNSFAAGFASALILVVLFQSLAPAFRTWWDNFQGLGNMAMSMLIIGVGFGAWSLGRIQQQRDPRNGRTASGGHGSEGGFGGTSSRSAPNSGMPPPPPPHGSNGTPPPPPRNEPPPQPQQDGPKTSWQQGPPPQSQAPPPPPPPPKPKPGPEPDPPPPPRPSPQARPPPPQTPPQTPPPSKSRPSRQSSPAPSKTDSPRRGGSWEKAREEMRRREEERRTREAEQKRREEAARRLAELRAKDAKERQEREKEKERREREARERKERLEAEQRAKELAEKLQEERKERERLEKEAKEAREREVQREKEAKELEEKKRKETQEREERRKKLAAEREAQRKKEADEARAREELRKQKEKAEKEKAEKEKAEREKAEKERAAREQAEKEKAEKEQAEREKASQSPRTGGTYAFAGVGERMSMWPNGRPPAPKSTTSSASKNPPPSAAPSSSSPKNPTPSTTASSSTPKKAPPSSARSGVSGVSTESSYRPYDKAKKPQHKKSASSLGSESSWAASHSTARTSPPPSVRGPYTTDDPDKIVISAVYLFMNQYAKTPASQLIPGVGAVTDGLILRITTEGLFIDDDVRSVPQREWDVKAWTLKQVEVWCPPHCLNSLSSPSPSPGIQNNPYFKMAASRARTKPLTGNEADLYLREMLRACQECCRFGLCDRNFKDTNVPSPTGQTGEWKSKGLHVLRATIRDQEGKRYVFVIDESESWKVAAGLQRLRKGSQVRQLAVSGMAALEARGTLENLGWA